MYAYSEHFGGKGPNKVISMLDHYISTQKPPNRSKLHIFCDNCYSQNKNQFLFVYLDNLCVLGTFEKIFVTYPIPGHSYMPADRALIEIEKKRRRTETVIRPEEWLRKILSARLGRPFRIYSLNFNLSLDLLPSDGI